VQAETIQAPELARAEARLPRWMIGLAVAGTVAALLAGHASVGAGFGLGAALGILNYRWLHQAVEALMTAGQSRPSRWLIAKFLVRYPLAFAVVYVFYRTGWLPFGPVLVGLFVPAGGVLIEAVFQLRAGLSSGTGT